ncbi:2-amino-4-hydroxy-6-hydroxymethyldihydropteridine diphosphokinase [Tsukamurella sp. 8F]|uniref:2-amino-4-hydroxy-6- hydroxymethyldihydropteridine diphosphokinase n=1 Tax=unclassified Tsukamurella TaxID=2633480 RepID=UPI0023B9467C|nr:MULTISPECIES: 2-amino-4-hydroxy-6-hydroxymethyldihydropteridine diphosphokinase [unclassified Tsukamurella]MDF0530916.1 2-amino-4-hydroxy-6-hydroxymethyldihydropteridine diphosphokinase [Tsukamurella sp. 8J]MDF0588241.1 2-amino-4-hydroxy-6-hydroxymethyldihydropteridine diphosphokinase [Tsukamurella sp. 8F]
MTRAVLSFGGNIGDAAATVRAAVGALGPALVAASRAYVTPPWGGVEQADFVNVTAIADDPARDAAGWLEFAREREAAADRVRDVRWGPRTLDVDVVAVWSDGESVLSQDPELTLPHPRAHVRAFVLVPWLDADPDAELPGHGRVDGLLAGLPRGDVDGVRCLPEGAS